MLEQRSWGRGHRVLEQRSWGRGHRVLEQRSWGRGHRVLEQTCDRQLKALNMSKRTKQVKVIVVSRGVTLLSKVI